MTFSDIVKFKRDGKIGIIGGGGRMGQWALTLFNSLGYNNLFYHGRNRKEDLEESTGAKFIDNKKEIAEVSDLLIVSVPISKTLDIIHEVGKFVNDEMIFADFTSVKKKACEAMGKYSKRVVGIHPMFKETVKDLKNKNIVLTPLDVEGQREDVEFLRKMFGESGAKIRIVSPEVHDKITSFNQAGVHLMLMTYGNLLKSYCRKNGITLADLESLNTPNSQLMNLLLGRFLATGNYDVLWGIQNSTEESAEMRKIFMESVEAVIGNLDKDDFKQFESDLSAISRKFQKARLMIESEDSNELVTSLGNFGTEKHFDDQKEVVVSILADLSGTLKVFDNDGVDGTVLRMVRCCGKIEEDFVNGNYRECIASALKCRNVLEKTLMSGKRRWQSPVKDNLATYDKIDRLINDFIKETRVLSELSELL
jgi:prephenate dehydrogenase